MEQIDVALGERSYPILIGTGILADVGEACRSRRLGSRAMLVSNTTVGPLYADAVARSLAGAGFAVDRFLIPDGEQYKNLETLESIYSECISQGLDRHSFLVALGGGVVGDIAGFAAATFLRGIPVVQLPTSLLSQVDSSVGGKTGINHPLGKNLVGAFHQPSLVLIDVETLQTLPDREYRSGLAEVVKYGVVLDGDFFAGLESSVHLLRNRDREALVRAVSVSCATKAAVVEQDEKEGGLRAVLNYGHTLGHAAETLTHYRDLLHGEAVAAGMVSAARISQRNGFAGGDDTRRIVALLDSLGLPVELPRFSPEEYAEALYRDKKMRDGGLRFVCNRGIGGHAFLDVRDIGSLLRDIMTGD